ncbi:ABC transporter substrate-binding protein [Pontibacter sp. SGAir0037]|uniref:ABC transporter substrate-binding protein n=1 Tax=Pontibacter sp. SGAir0037 TaxID=2571030 RepID=UPI0010CD38CD|nr:helical backbone metal receptor [Pontibacter sp. SGAir0037]QCR21031.1 iron ABC transporter substrate-binding protein [Pontibacter sp. SGAir0037]
MKKHTPENTSLVRAFRFFFILLLFALYACYGKKNEQQEPLVLKDDLGREVKLTRQPVRVLSLAASMTEMLFAVCDTAHIVGRTPHCNYPAGVEKKPVVSNYPVDYEQVLRLKPDIVFTVEGITPLETAARLEELGIPVYYQRYYTVEDIFTALEDIGQIVGREQVAKHLADSLRQQVQEIAQRHQQHEKKQRVLAVTWTDPIYVYGQNTSLTDKLRILGAENAVKEVFQDPYPALTREYILKLNPDVLLGGTPEKLEDSFFGIYPELRRIDAYQHKRLYDPTGDLIARPSPRVVESILELEKFLYP